MTIVPCLSVLSMALLMAGDWHGLLQAMARRCGLHRPLLAGALRPAEGDNTCWKAAAGLI